MVLKFLFSAFLHKARAVEKLSESRVMRRAAQLTAGAVLKAQLAGKDAAAALLRSDTVRQIRREAGSPLPRGVGALRGTAGRLKDSVVKDVTDGVNVAARRIKRKGS